MGNNKKDRGYFESVFKSVEDKISDMKEFLNERGIVTDIFEKNLKDIYLETKGTLSRKDKLFLSRHPDRPHSCDYIKHLFQDVVPLRGDRTFGEDLAILSGMARFEGHTVCFIGQDKGKNTKDRIRKNFGQPHPEGYRKAKRVMKLAERFGFPIVSFVDTQGAFPGIGAEERGQACAIAENLEFMSSLKVPNITFIIGEGGSGGALGIAISNKVFMLEHSMYSVISPEGCASILYKSKEPEFIERAVDNLKFCSSDLEELGIIDGVIEEGVGAHKEPHAVYESVRKYLYDFLNEFSTKSDSDIVSHRMAKFRNMKFHTNRGDKS